MDRFLEHYRRYHWAANSLLVLAIAYVLAGIGVRMAVDTLVPMPAPKPRTAAVVKNDRPATFADYQVILSRNLLHAKVEDAAPPPAAVEESTDAPVKATIQATLLGTVAGPAKYAFAVVQASGKNEVVRIGERIANAAEVLEIHRGRIVILNNGRKEELSMYDEKPLPGNADARPETRRPVAMPSEPVEASPEVSVMQTSETSFEIDQADFEQMTTNLGPLLTQARVVPHFEGGAINGYKIFAIKPDSLYMKIGLENGDVIHSINGIKVDSPEKALQMFQSLRTERNFNINLSRNSSPLTFNYTLR